MVTDSEYGGNDHAQSRGGSARFPVLDSQLRDTCELANVVRDTLLEPVTAHGARLLRTLEGLASPAAGDFLEETFRPLTGNFVDD